MRTDRLCGIEAPPKPAVGKRCWQQARMALALVFLRLTAAMSRSRLWILNSTGRYRDSAPSLGSALRPGRRASRRS